MQQTLIVVEDSADWSFETAATLISFEKYLHDYPKLNEPKTRIINVCDTENYLSKGYYCSLLAEARCHRVLPSVKTINALRNRHAEAESYWLAENDVSDLESLKERQEHFIFFGACADKRIERLAGKLFQQFPAPVLKMTLYREHGKLGFTLKRESPSVLNPDQRDDFLQALHAFTQTVWRGGAKGKRLRWDMAILIDPEEKVPPSNRQAITRFVKAAAKLGINAQTLQVSELQNIDQYDALFVREATAIDHHTYRLVNKAESAGLIVMDDSASILRCCNKVFLHDAFNYNGVPSLKTLVVSDQSDETLMDIERQLSYPLILKMPEGSFSLGVFKVANREQLREKLTLLFQDNALVLAQEFLFTEYDWRIGVLNGRAIFACRYYMARNHWQIYNHESRRYFSGDFETLPTFEVPKPVLDAALKAAKVVGDGLYGVDLKYADGKAYVMEVNDNPNIDHKIEDAYLGDELYMQIMAEFLRRLETRGR